MKRLKMIAVSAAAFTLAALILPVRAMDDAELASLSSPALREVPTSLSDPPATTLVADGHLDIVDTANQYGLATFVTLLEDLGIAEDLRGYGRFTVFAPSDSAFSAFLAANPQFQGELTPSLRDELATLLSYHVIAMAQPITTDSFVSVLGSSSATQRTLARPDVALRLRRGDIYVNGIEASDSDIEASNGVIHVIDQVLLLPN